MHNRAALLPFQDMITTKYILPIAFLKIGVLIIDGNEKQSLASRSKICQER
jgi:hypothetical protein